MKKLFAVLLTFAMMLCFAACTVIINESDSKETKAAETGVTVDVSKDETEVTEATEEDKEPEKTNYAANNTEYFIGGTGPLTGDASSYGIAVQNGAKLAIEKINNEFGGLNGRMFKLDIKDDQANSTMVSPAYDQLLEAGMQISIGSVTGMACEAFSARSAIDNLFFMTPTATANRILEGDHSFRLCLGDDYQGATAAKELVANFNNIGVIYDDSDIYSSGIFEAFEAEMKTLGATYIVKSFNAENKLDFSTQAEALKDCDVIFLPIYYTDAGLIAEAIADIGCDAVLYGCDGLDGIAGYIDETVTNTIMYMVPFDLNSTDPVVLEFVKAYEDAYGTKPDQFAADGYDAVMAIYMAMKDAGIDDVTIDPSTLCDKVFETITADGFKYDGITGSKTWNTHGEAQIEKPIIVVVQ